MQGMTEILEAEQTTESASWDSGVAEEHKSAISGFTDTASLAKGYSELYSKMGSQVKMPTADSPAEEVSAFYKQLGRPNTAEGYTEPTLADGGEVDKAFFGGMAAIAHEAGLSGTQFDKMVERYLGFEAQAKEAQLVEYNRRLDEADRELHEDTEFGADYDGNLELSKRAYTDYAPQELKDLLDTDRWKALRNEPSFIKMFTDIAKKNMDDTFVKSDGQKDMPKDGYTPASPNSPQMYAMMDGEEGAKARNYFRAKGHVYDRKD